MTKFGNFFQTDFTTVPLNTAFPWSNQSPSNGVKLDPSNNKKIIIEKAGKYKIDFVVFIENQATSTFYSPSVLIQRNGRLVRKSRFALQLFPTSGVCLQLTGTVIIGVLRDNSVIKLINRSGRDGDSTDIVTCNNGPVAATISVVKIG